MQIIRPECDEGVEAEQHGRCSRNRLVRPLTLGLDAEVAADFGEGDLEGPASDEPGQDVCRARIAIGAEESLRLERAGRIVNRRGIGTPLVG